MGFLRCCLHIIEFMLDEETCSKYTMCGALSGTSNFWEKIDNLEQFYKWSIFERGKGGRRRVKGAKAENL